MTPFSTDMRYQLRRACGNEDGKLLQMVNSQVNDNLFTGGPMTGCTLASSIG